MTTPAVEDRPCYNTDMQGEICDMPYGHAGNHHCSTHKVSWPSQPAVEDERCDAACEGAHVHAQLGLCRHEILAMRERITTLEGELASTKVALGRAQYSWQDWKLIADRLEAERERLRGALSAAQQSLVAVGAHVPAEAARQALTEHQ